MSERISIPALRDQLALESDPDQPRAIYQGELAALVEAVEAAHDLLHDTPKSLRRGTTGPYADLTAALARFDFGEET